MIRLALRFDDPSVTSDAALEDAIFHALARSRVPATVAVIPFRKNGRERIALDSARASHLIHARSAGTIEIAMHGNDHEMLSTGNYSEFCDLPAAEQHRKLEEGLRQLQAVFGDVVDGFVPPFNSYDRTTAECAIALGLRYISAAWNKSWVNGLVFLPRTCRFHELDAAIAEARRFPQLSPIVIPVLHHYDFRESGSPDAFMDLSGFETLLRQLAEQRDVEMLTLGALAAQISPAASVAALRRHWRFKYLHWRILSRLPQLGMTTASWPHIMLSVLLNR